MKINGNNGSPSQPANNFENYKNNIIISIINISRMMKSSWWVSLWNVEAFQFFLIL